MKISVIIPAYNEDLFLKSTVEEVIEFFNLQDNLELEIIVINDGSTDKTGEICNNFSKKYNFFKYFLNKKNRGKGFSIKKGVKEALGDILLFMDADSSTKIDGLSSMVLEINKGNDIVIGSRAMKESIYIKHQPFFKEFVAKIGNKIIKLFLKLPFNDTQCGFKLFSRSSICIFEKQTIDRWGFDFEILYIAKKYNLKIAEIPVVWKNNENTSVKKTDYFIVLCNVFQVLINDMLGFYKMK